MKDITLEKLYNILVNYINVGKNNHDKFEKIEVIKELLEEIEKDFFKNMNKDDKNEN